MGVTETAPGPQPIRNIADELATRAGLDPTWDAVLRQYLAGAAEWPEPFQSRPPR
jgi:hypothetical protein